MAEWSVHIEADGGNDFGEPEAESLIDALASYAPVVSYGLGGITIRLNVTATSAQEAVSMALAAFGRVADELEVFRVEAQTAEDLEQELGTPNIPSIVGVAELAELLGVSKQRVSELMRGRDFPAPLVVLAAGPIWSTVHVVRYVRRWKRRPGRPRKVMTAARGATTTRAKEH